MRQETKIWLEGTIIAALAMTLSFIPSSIGTSFSISLGQIPLTLFALRRGFKPGIVAGLIWGLLHFLVGQVVYLSLSQVIIEYVFAFAFIGFAGLYAHKLHQAVAQNKLNQARVIIVQGTFLGMFTRYFWHFVAGVIFWGKYALWGMNPWMFSLVMNGASGVATALVTVVVLLAIFNINPLLFAEEK